MPGLIATPVAVPDASQYLLEFQRKERTLVQLTGIVHELSSESAALFQTIKFMMQTSRNLKKIASKSTEDVVMEEVNQLITEYEANKQSYDTEYYYEEGREQRNKELRDKIDKIMKLGWDEALEGIEVEIGRTHLKIKKWNQRILHLKSKSLDVSSEIILQLTSFPYYDQEQIQTIESLISKLF